MIHKRQGVNGQVDDKTQLRDFIVFLSRTPTVWVKGDDDRCKSGTDQGSLLRYYPALLIKPHLMFIAVLLVKTFILIILSEKKCI